MAITQQEGANGASATSGRIGTGREETTNGSPDQTCQECQGDLATQDHEVVCKSCGLVVEMDNIRHGPEWRGIEENGTSMRRCNGRTRSLMMHDYGLSTEIGRSTSSSRRMVRLRFHNRTESRKTVRNLKYAFGQVARITATLELPDVIGPEACTILREAQSEGLFVGDSMDRMIGGAIYAACRRYSVPCVPRRLVGAIGMTDERANGSTAKRWVMRGYSKLSRELGLKIEPFRATDLVPFGAEQLSMPTRIKQYAIALAERAKDAEGFVDTGTAPSSLAAACLYHAGQEAESKYTQAEVGDTLDVTPMTLRQVHEKLREIDDLPSPPSSDHRTTVALEAHESMSTSA